MIKFVKWNKTNDSNLPCLASGHERTPLLQLSCLYSGSLFGQKLWFQCWTNRGVLPVEDDLWDVVGLLHLGVFAPVFTADSYHSILIHALKEETHKSKILNPLIKQSQDCSGWNGKLPLQGFLRMLRGNMHTKVLKRLHELLRVDIALKGKQRQFVRISHCQVKNETKWALPHHLKPHTCILPVEAFHHKLQVFLVILQIVNKLLKVQLCVWVIFFPF